MGHYEPDMLSVPSRVFVIQVPPIYLKIYCSGKDFHIVNTYWNVSLHSIAFPDLIGYNVSVFWF